MTKLVCLLLSVIAISQVSGHGMLLDPPNRSSLWRFDEEFPINYNDNENFCGGIRNQWDIQGGKCGVCGDDYGAPHPQANENTGTYGLGKIVHTYKAGQIIETSVLLTANHLGHFTFSLCELKDTSRHESGDDCFKPLLFSDGNTEFPITANDVQVVNKIQLPENFTCEHCVLRWHYSGGNNWGECEDGTSNLGCGPQETFRSCSDIAIV